MKVSCGKCAQTVDPQLRGVTGNASIVSGNASVVSDEPGRN